MQTEFYILQHGGNHRVRVEEDLLPVESQLDESETGETGIPSQISKSLVAPSVVLVAVALDDQSITDQQVHPFEVGAGNAHLGSGCAPGSGKKNPHHTLGAGICAIVDEPDERSPRSGQSSGGTFQVETERVRAAEEPVQDRDHVFHRLGGDELSQQVGDRCDAECVAERSSSAGPKDPDILSSALEGTIGIVGVPQGGGGSPC